MTKLIGGNISDTPIKNIGDGSAFSAGGGGAGWNGIPWDPKNDGLSITHSDYGYNQTGASAWGTLSSGGVIVGLTGEGNAAAGTYYLQFPNAGRIDIGNHIGASTEEFTSGWLGHMWLPAGTSIGNTGFAQNVVVHKVEGSYDDCLKLFPGLIDMSQYDEVTNLRGFSTGTGGYSPYSASNPNGCTIFYFSGSPEHGTYNEFWYLEIRDSGGTAVTNGRIVASGVYTNISGDTEISDNFRIPLPLKLDADEQIYNGTGGYVIAYDPDGWV
jgi:hypothetical protein